MLTESNAAATEAPYRPDWALNPGFGASAATSPTAASSMNTSETGEITEKKEVETKDKIGKGAAVGGAAAVAGIAGLCLIGPVIGVVAAGGAAYVAVTNKGAAGSVFRAGGTAASKTGRGIAGGVGWINRKVNGNKNQTTQNA